VAGSLHPARPAGVSSEVVSLVGVFCKVLVTRACGDGVTMPLGAPDLGGGSGPAVAYLVYAVRARLLDLQFVGAWISGVDCQQAWHPKIAG
jgi:hypothetical protein